MLTMADPDTNLDQSVDQIAAVAKALSHPARLRIIGILLSRPGCIGYDIVEEVGLAQSTVSEHLRILKASGLVTGEITRPRVCYSLNVDAFGPLADLLKLIAAKAADADTACCTTAATPTDRVPSNA